MPSGGASRGYRRRCSSSSGSSSSYSASPSSMVRRGGRSPTSRGYRSPHHSRSTASGVTDAYQPHPSASGTTAEPSAAHIASLMLQRRVLAPPPDLLCSSDVTHDDDDAAAGKNSDNNNNNNPIVDGSERGSDAGPERSPSLSSTVQRAALAAVDGGDGGPRRVSHFHGWRPSPLRLPADSCPSPRGWPFISPVREGTEALPLFTPTLQHLPPPVVISHNRRRTLLSAPPGSVAAAIRTDHEGRESPPRHHVPHRARHDKLPHPSCLTFGEAYRSSGRGRVLRGRDRAPSPAASPRDAALQSSTGVVQAETEVASTPPRDPISNILAERQQRKRVETEKRATARERTNGAILQSHHVPLVPFSTWAEEADMPPAVLTHDDAMATVDDEMAYYLGNYSSVQAPRTLERAMTRERVRPPHRNVMSTKKMRHGDDIFRGVIRYAFGRRAGAGAAGGGRSAFLDDDDPSQFWVSKFNAQTQFRFDPLLREDLMIDDRTDDDAHGTGRGIALSPPQQLTPTHGHRALPYFHGGAGGGSARECSLTFRTIGNHHHNSPGLIAMNRF